MSKDSFDLKYLKCIRQSASVRNRDFRTFVSRKLFHSGVCNSEQRFSSQTQSRGKFDCKTQPISRTRCLKGIGAVRVNIARRARDENFARHTPQTCT